MITVKRASDSIELQWTGNVPTIYQMSCAAEGSAPLGVSGVVYEQTHTLRFEGLQSNTLYTLSGALMNDQNLPVEEYVGSVRTLGDYQVTTLRVDPTSSGFYVRLETTQSAAVRISATTPSSHAYVYEDSSERASRDITLTGLPPGTQVTLTFELFSVALGDQRAQVVSATRPVFVLEQAHPVFQQMYAAVTTLQEYTGSLLLGLTAFLNNVKYTLRYATLSDYVPGAINLEDRQRQAFEDQMSYYYATTVSLGNALAMIQRASEWFVYDNVDNLDPSAKPFTREQKSAVIKIIKQVADNTVRTATVAQIKQTIRRLNALELAPEGSPLRAAYDALGSTPLGAPGVIDYVSLLDNGTHQVDIVETIG